MVSPPLVNEISKEWETSQYYELDERRCRGTDK